MDFFQHQDNARKRTFMLIGLYTACVIAIILAVYLPLAFFIAWDNHDPRTAKTLGDWWLDLGLLGLVGCFMLFTMGVASWWKIRGLASGGGSVATMLGGRLVDPDTSDPDERKLINVVQEMSIASGTPVPLVFILPNEPGLNAFAAGYTVDDAAVAVTAGGIRTWTRDELQAVIAHEFSHILNGDMRLNIRLIGWLHGILFLTVIGRFIIRGAAGGGGRSRGNSRGGGGAAAVVILGLLIILIGLIGSFFAKIIQAAISRQREYLADASAVQFTRNPMAMASALQKVADATDSSIIQDSHASQMSHLFFSNPLKRSFWRRMFATHPGLRDRVERISPMAGHHIKEQELSAGSLTDGVASMLSPMGSALSPELARERAITQRIQAHSASLFRGAPDSELASAAALSSNQTPAAGSGDAHRTEATEISVRLSADEILAQIGQPGGGHLAISHHILQVMPNFLRTQTQKTLGAISILYALILDTEAERRAAQLDLIKSLEHPSVDARLREILPHIDEMNPGFRLPLLDLTIPVIRSLSEEQRNQFRATITAAFRDDATLSLLQFTTRKVILRRVDRAAGEGLKTRPQFLALAPLAKDISVLLSVMARAGTTDSDDKEAFFKAGRDSLPSLVRSKVSEVSQEHCSFLDLDRALERTASSVPNIKRPIFEACVRTALADGILTFEQTDVLRTVAECLDIPMPPLLPSSLLQELNLLTQRG